jgi:hypothetical protein
MQAFSLRVLGAASLTLLLYGVWFAVELTGFTSELRYFCQTCPYVYRINKKVRHW